MENKQETHEEAFDRIFDSIDYIEFDYTSFEQGAKWMQERSYSEEELKSAFKIGFNIGYGSPVQELDLKNEHCEKWFNQFKKK